MRRISSGEGRRMSSGQRINGRSWNNGDNSFGGLIGGEIRAEGAGGWRV